MKGGLFSVSRVLLCVTGVISGCSTLPDQGDLIVAKVNDRLISEKEWVRLLPKEDQETYLTFKKQRVDRLVAQTLFEQEAERRQISVQALLEQEILSKAAPPIQVSMKTAIPEKTMQATPSSSRPSSRGHLRMI